MDRQPGFYHVKYEGRWIVAEWYNYFTIERGGFVWQYGIYMMGDSILEEINENRILMPDMRQQGAALAAAIIDDAKNGNLMEFKPNGDPAKLWEMAVEATIQEVRSVMDHCEYDIEYKSDVNGEYLHIDKLLDRVDVENPFEEDSHPLSDKLQAMFENAAERAAKGEITFNRKGGQFASGCTVSAGFSFSEPLEITDEHREVFKRTMECTADTMGNVLLKCAGKKIYYSKTSLDIPGYKLIGCIQMPSGPDYLHIKDVSELHVTDNNIGESMWTIIPRVVDTPSQG